MESLRDFIDELRLMTAQIKGHAGTNEMHHIGVVSERIYQLAIEVKRIDDQIALLTAMSGKSLF